MRLWKDNNLGESIFYLLLPIGYESMRVPDEIRKCVCFVCSKTDDGSHVLRGTAFFLGIPIPGGKEHRIYLVTAKHVLDNIKHQRSDGEFFLRINDREGGSTLVPSNADDWHRHPDETVADDTAVLPWAPSLDQFDYLWVSVDPTALEQDMTRMDIGVGDEVFLPGLFIPHHGKTRNIPVVRVGNIAAIPNEFVNTLLGLIPAYLVEARSIGGLSGAPVFANVAGVRTIGTNVSIGTGPPIHFLGLMHGHFKVDPQNIDPSVGIIGDETINMGIAIVLPASRIFETIKDSESIEMRDSSN